MAWVALTVADGGGYASTETGTHIIPENTAAGWIATISSYRVDIGPFASFTLANDAIRKLVGGVPANELL